MTFQYSIAASPEPLTYAAPVPLRGMIADCARTAAHLGYEAIELHLTNPKRYSAAAITQMLKENGLRLSALATGLELNHGFCLIDNDKEMRRAAVARVREHIELAGALGGIVIIGCIRGNISDVELASERRDSLARLRESMSTLADYADEHGVTIVLEAINYYVNNYLNTLKETAAFIRSVNSSALRLHADTHHMNIGETELPSALQETGDLLGYIHYSDSNRLYPGGGHIDFATVAATLTKIGYRGYISMEITPFPDGITAARRAISHAKAVEMK